MLPCPSAGAPGNETGPKALSVSPRAAGDRHTTLGGSEARAPRHRPRRHRLLPHRGHLCPRRGPGARAGPARRAVSCPRHLAWPVGWRGLPFSCQGLIKAERFHCASSSSWKNKNKMKQKKKTEKQKTPASLATGGPTSTRQQSAGTLLPVPLEGTHGSPPALSPPRTPRARSSGTLV